MEETKSDQNKGKRTAEDWVSIARTFGEQCLEIQHDSNLNLDQKLEKQKTLSQAMAKEIKEDPILKEEDKKQMIASIDNYMQEWQSMHDIIQKTQNGQENLEK